MEEQIRILCVDDENNVLRALERSFLNEDYEILTASSGEEGLSMLRRFSPIQVVISDYRMPAMSGVEFLRQVREHWPDTVRMVLSAYTDIGVIISSINEGQIHRYIRKPWDNEELKTSVSNALERYFLNRKNLRITDELLFKIEELKQANFQLECLKSREKMSVRKAFGDMSGRILDILPAGVIAIDNSGLIILCNREAEKLLARQGAECLGMHCGQAFPAELSELMERLQGPEPAAGSLEMNGNILRVYAVTRQDPELPAIILLLTREAA